MEGASPHDPRNTSRAPHGQGQTKSTKKRQPLPGTPDDPSSIAHN